MKETIRNFLIAFLFYFLNVFLFAESDSAYLVSEGTNETYLLKIENDNITRQIKLGVRAVFGITDDRIIAISQKWVQTNSFPELNIFGLKDFSLYKSFSLSRKPISYIEGPVNGLGYNPQSEAIYVITYDPSALSLFDSKDGFLVDSYLMDRMRGSYLTTSLSGVLVYSRREHLFIPFTNSNVVQFLLHYSEPPSDILPDQEELGRFIGPKIFSLGNGKYIRVDATDVAVFDLPKLDSREAEAKVIYSTRDENQVKGKLLKPKITKISNEQWLLCGFSDSLAGWEQKFSKIVGINLNDPSNIQTIELPQPIFEFLPQNVGWDNWFCLMGKERKNKVVRFDRKENQISLITELSPEICSRPTASIFLPAK